MFSTVARFSPYTQLVHSPSFSMFKTLFVIISMSLGINANLKSLCHKRICHKLVHLKGKESQSLKHINSLEILLLTHTFIFVLFYFHG